MKLKKLLMLAIVAVLATMALVSCGGGGTTPPEPTPGPGSSETPSSSEIQTPTEPTEVTYTVTFHYGVKTWGDNKDTALDRPDEYLYTKVVEIVVLEGEVGEIDDAEFPEDNSQLNATAGYDWEDWLNANGEEVFYDEITGDIDIYAYYSTLEKYTYTFKNPDGSVIFSDWAYEGSSLSSVNPEKAIYFFPKDSVPADQVSNYGIYTDAAGNEYYMLKEDLENTDKCVALPVGTIFVKWESDKNGSVPTKLTANNTTFTASTEKADETIKYVAPTTFADGNLLDKTRYAKLENTFYKYIISSKITDIPKEFDCSVLDKYATREDAVNAGEGELWDTANTYWSDSRNGITADFYMAWDGEYIYFLADVKDPKVVTMSKSYCMSRDNPYENDAVEVWYAIGGAYHKICLDACGYKLFSGWNASAYLQYIRDEGLAQAQVMQGTQVIDVSSGDAKILAQGTDAGYMAAFAFPAYEEPENPAAFDVYDKTQWGKKLNRGAAFYLSLQVDNVSAPAEQSVIDSVVAQSADKGGIHNMSSEEMREAIGRINLGWQMDNKKPGVGTLKLCLG